jgi:plastocyanin
MHKVSVLLLIFILCTAITCGCTMPVTTPSAPAATAAPAAHPVTQAAAAASGETAEVSIIASAFDPAILNIRQGTTVIWTNDDRINHRVEHLPELPSDRLLFRSESLSPGQKYQYTFTQAGRYKYSDPQQAGGRTALIIVT